MRLQSRSIPKRLLSGFRRQPILILALLFLFLGIILFVIVLVRGDVSQSVWFELGLLYPDWVILILLPLFIGVMFTKLPANEKVSDANSNHSVSVHRPEEPLPIQPLPPYSQTPTQRQPVLSEIYLQPLPDFLAEACVSCGRRVEPGSVLCPFCVKSR